MAGTYLNLIVYQQPQSLFFKDKGGKRNQLQFKVGLDVDSLHLIRPLPLRVSLYTQHDAKVEDEGEKKVFWTHKDVYEITPEEPFIDVWFRIEKVSSKAGMFKVGVGPLDPADDFRDYFANLSGPVYINTAFSDLIEVRSKVNDLPGRFIPRMGPAPIPAGPMPPQEMMSGSQLSEEEDLQSLSTAVLQLAKTINDLTGAIQVLDGRMHVLHKRLAIVEQHCGLDKHPRTHSEGTLSDIVRHASDSSKNESSDGANTNTRQSGRTSSFSDALNHDSSLRDDHRISTPRLPSPGLPAIASPFPGDMGMSNMFGPLNPSGQQAAAMPGLSLGVTALMNRIGGLDEPTNGDHDTPSGTIKNEDNDVGPSNGAAASPQFHDPTTIFPAIDAPSTIYDAYFTTPISAPAIIPLVHPNMMHRDSFDAMDQMIISADQFAHEIHSAAADAMGPYDGHDNGSGRRSRRRSMAGSEFGADEMYGINDTPISHPKRGRSHRAFSDVSLHGVPTMPPVWDAQVMKAGFQPFSDLSQVTVAGVRSSTPVEDMGGSLARKRRASEDTMDIIPTISTTSRSGRTVSRVILNKRSATAAEEAEGDNGRDSVASLLTLMHSSDPMN